MIPRIDSRRAPRVALRASAVLAFASSRWQVLAEDLASGGCQFVSPFPLRRGEAIYLTLQLPAPAGELATQGTIAWSSRTPPYRAGVEFARTGGADRERRIRALVGADPALARDPAVLRPSMRLRLGAPPGPRSFFSRDELLVLRAAREGSTALELFGRASGRCHEVRKTLLALLAHGVVHEGSPREPERGWAELLPPETPRFGPAPSAETAEASNPFAARPDTTHAACLVELASAESAAGRFGPAVEWLQAALAGAPDDPEIARAIDALTVSTDAIADPLAAAPAVER
jgi:hypothetical protein